MANTPFPTPIGENDGYVYEHPTTGRKYQLSTYRSGVDTANVWSAVSDVKNRTWVGSNDPLEDNPGTNGPVAGDTWWDTQYLELRVLHHPIMGINDSGKEPVPIYGKKQWISCTHPMANMLGEGGADKNQMIGQVMVTSPDPFILEGESIIVNMSIPYYTGFDNFYEDPTDDPVPYDDKRFTVEWTVYPTHNGDIEGLSVDDAKEYENTIELVDPDWPNRAKVRMGKLPDTTTVSQMIKAQCTVTVKEEYNNEFIIMGLDEDGKPEPHTSFGEKTLNNGKRETAEVIVPVAIARQTLNNFVANEDLPDNLSTEMKGEIVEYFYIKNGEFKVPNPPDGGNPTGEVVILSKKNNYSDVQWIGGDLADDDVAGQLPHVGLRWDFGEFSETTIIFDFGEVGSGGTIKQRLEEVDPDIDIDLFEDGNYAPETDMFNFKFKFFEKGFKLNNSGDGPELPKASDFDVEYSSDIQNDYVMEDGSIHCVIILTLNYSTAVVPEEGLFFVATNINGDIVGAATDNITSHGQIYRPATAPSLVDESDDNTITDETTEETPEETP